MKHTLVFITACLFSSLTANVCFAAKASQVDRGRYLVEEIGKCGDCHTPRLASGELDRTKWLKGTVLDFKPVADIPIWQGASVDLTPGGQIWKSWGESGIVKFLTTGVAPNGQPPRPPMPAYKMKTADAKAIVAYLKSLK